MSRSGWRRLPAARSLLAIVVPWLTGCAILPGAGPTSRTVVDAGKAGIAQASIHIVDVTDAIAQQIMALSTRQSLYDGLGDGIPAGSVIQRGDVLDILIWEAPPAVLFGSAIGGAARLDSSTISHATSFPEQMVDSSDNIRVPFAGVISAAGKSTTEIAAEIRARLAGKAHDPQIIVRLTRNASSNVTIVGEVTNSTRLSLTSRGERLLDALASAGGVRQPVGKMTVQVTRGDKVEAMPLSDVIKDPRQNIRLQADDVVTLLYQPYSFTVLGASRTNQEIAFEGTGLKLSQALGRMGGLDDQRANPKGVFIFRFEDAKVLAPGGETAITTKDGKVPVIYRVDMRDPATLFVAQTFPIKDKDVIYVSNAPLADFQKFLQAVTQIVYPIATIQSTNIF